ncbi:hypothetical protein TcWFU_008671 [Taenia crassiceps]|uniref:Uncharacterized protein n=1 Tax=Taenia crassiceps TaxID=6207 RepID=A0ABR4QEY8_9CEST
MWGLSVVGFDTAAGESHLVLALRRSKLHKAKWGERLAGRRCASCVECSKLGKFESGDLQCIAASAFGSLCIRPGASGRDLFLICHGLALTSIRKAPSVIIDQFERSWRFQSFCAERHFWDLGELIHLADAVVAHDCSPRMRGEFFAVSKLETMMAFAAPTLLRNNPSVIIG